MSVARQLILSLAIASGLVAPTLARATLPADVRVSGVPAWVAPAPPAAATPQHGGACIARLDDRQIRVGATAAEQQSFRRRVWQVESVAGLERLGELEIEYEPGYEHLIVHTLRIEREGESIDALPQVEARVAQRERSLAERQYDDERTLVLILADLRVGDRVTLEYTVQGANPVFGDKMVGSFGLITMDPTDVLRLSVSMPATRTLHTRLNGVSDASVIESAGEQRSYQVVRHAVPAFSHEDDVPSGVDPIASLDVSEFATWQEVAAWARPLYAAAGGKSPELDKKIAEIRAASADRGERLRLATRFVQDDVRYLGMELGPHSHRPHDAGQVLRQRFGDCKDKVALLATLLRGLDIEATPALTLLGTGVLPSAALASPLAFDHVVLRVGASTWIDPTRSQEHGPVGSVELGVRETLPLDASEPVALPLAQPTDPDIDIVQRVHKREQGDGFALDIRTTRVLGRAIGQRARLAQETREETQRRLLQKHHVSYPELSVLAPLEVEDARDADRIVLTEHYLISNSSAFSVDIDAGDVFDLETPARMPRTLPFALDAHSYYRSTLELDTDVAPMVDETVEHSTFAFSRTFRQEGTTSKVTFSLRTLRDRVEPGQLNVYLERVQELRQASAVRVRFLDPNDKEDDPSRATAQVWRLFAIGLGPALLIATLVYVVRTRRRRSWRRAQAKNLAGGAPADALEAENESAARKHFAAQRCSCGAAFAEHEPRATVVRFGESTRTVLRAECSKCSTASVFYYRLRS